MSKNGGPINADRLKSFIDRIERMEEERKAIGGDIREVYSEAKGVGYDVKTMRRIVALRRQDSADRAEAEALLDIYLHALGMDTSATVVTVQPSEDELEERASRIVREVDRCMALVENGRLPRIVDIKELIGCSTGKAGKLRGLVAERISRSNAIHRENPENENPPHDAETGELVDDGGEPAADVSQGTSAASRAARWAATSCTGVSSLAIMSMMMGEAPHWHSYPRDAGDFGRCAGLLDAVPEWRQRMVEMAAVGPEWAALAQHWPELSAMHSVGDHDGVYRRIGELVRPLEAKRSNVVQVSDGARIIMPDDAPDPGPIPDFLRRERAMT